MTNDDLKEARRIIQEYESRNKKCDCSMYEADRCLHCRARRWLLSIARTENKESERPEYVDEFIYYDWHEEDGALPALRATSPLVNGNVRARYRFDSIIQPPIEGGEK